MSIMNVKLYSKHDYLLPLTPSMPPTIQSTVREPTFNCMHYMLYTSYQWCPLPLPFPFFAFLQVSSAPSTNYLAICPTPFFTTLISPLSRTEMSVFFFSFVCDREWTKLEFLILILLDLVHYPFWWSWNNYLN